MSDSRRVLLRQSLSVAGALAAAGLWPGPAWAQAPSGGWNAAAFDGRSLADVVKALGASKPVLSRDVTLTAPDIAENGAVVPMEVSTALPGVRRLALLVEKNPTVLMAVFDLSEAVDASVSLRVKMAESSNVYAVAILGDARVLYAVKDVRVTLGGCAA